MTFFKALLPSFLWLDTGLHPVPFTSVVEDTGDGWDSASCRYIVPASGVYQVHAMLYPEQAETYPTFVSLQIYRQGADALLAKPALLLQPWQSSFAGPVVLDALLTDRFDPGQVLYVQTFIDPAAGRVQVASPEYESRLTITRLGD